MKEYFMGFLTWSTLGILVYIAYLIYEGWNLIKNKAFDMTPEPLTEQMLFKCAIRIPVISFIYFGIFSWWGHHPNLTQQGFSNFIEYGKLPLGLLSLSIPFVAVINNIHRTIQTNKQIKETERKNLVDIYFSHHKNYTEYFTKIESADFKYHYVSGGPFETTLTIEKPNKLYKAIFTKSGTTSNDFSPSRDFFDEIDSIIIDINKLTITFDTHIDVIERFEAVKSIDNKLTELSKLMYINKFKPRHYNNIVITGFSFKTIFWDEISLRLILSLYLYVYKELYDVVGLDIPSAVDVPNLTAFSSSKTMTFSEWGMMQTDLVNLR